MSAGEPALPTRVRISLERIDTAHA